MEVSLTQIFDRSLSRRQFSLRYRLLQAGLTGFDFLIETYASELLFALL
jgi:hypothetical protein